MDICIFNIFCSHFYAGLFNLEWNHLRQIKTIYHRTKTIGLVIAGRWGKVIHPVGSAVFHPDFQMMNTKVPEDVTKDTRSSTCLPVGYVRNTS